MKLANDTKKGFGGISFTKRKNFGVKKDYKKASLFEKFKSRYGEGSFEWVLHDGTPHYVYTTKDQKMTTMTATLRKGSLYVDNLHSFFLGKHPLRNNTRKQKFSIPSVEIMKFCTANEDFFSGYEFDFGRCVINQGCWHTNKHTLQRQMIPSVSNAFTSKPDISVIKRLKNSVRKF
jgi:hypothetical protein